LAGTQCRETQHSEVGGVTVGGDRVSGTQCAGTQQSEVGGDRGGGDTVGGDTAENS
jgi:hypothetical protein